MSDPEILALVRRYFEEHQDEEVKPGPLTGWVAKERGLGFGDQIGGSVRSALHDLVSMDLIERLSGMPLRYRWKK